MQPVIRLLHPLVDRLARLCIAALGPLGQLDPLLGGLDVEVVQEAVGPLLDLGVGIGLGQGRLVGQLQGTISPLDGNITAQCFTPSSSLGVRVTLSTRSPSASGPAASLSSSGMATVRDVSMPGGSRVNS